MLPLRDAKGRKSQVLHIVALWEQAKVSAQDKNSHNLSKQCPFGNLLILKLTNPLCLAAETLVDSLALIHKSPASQTFNFADNIPSQKSFSPSVVK